MPSGNTSQSAEAIYQHMWAQRFNEIPEDRVHILWLGPFWVLVFAIVLIGFFYLYSLHLQSAHRKHGSLYGVMSFAGTILERIGPVSPFSWVLWVVTTLWALYFIITHILLGQNY